MKKVGLLILAGLLFQSFYVIVKYPVDTTLIFQGQAYRIGRIPKDSPELLTSLPRRPILYKDSLGQVRSVALDKAFHFYPLSDSTVMVGAECAYKYAFDDQGRLLLVDVVYWWLSPGDTVLERRPGKHPHSFFNALYPDRDTIFLDRCTGLIDLSYDPEDPDDCMSPPYHDNHLFIEVRNGRYVRHLDLTVAEYREFCERQYNAFRGRPEYRQALDSLRRQRVSKRLRRFQIRDLDRFDSLRIRERITWFTDTIYP